MFTLSQRGALAAVDGAQVPDTGQFMTVQVDYAVVSCQVSVTGAPASFNFRAAVEASMDGVSWEQVIRFVDFTAAGIQVARCAAQTSISDATEAGAVLSGAAAAAVLIDTPWPRYLRAVTMLQALTGGTAPTVTGLILLDVGQ